MLLAELEVWHSRPNTPTRRVALGHLVLPVDPPPGFGGLLLGAVVAAHVQAIDTDALPDLSRLIGEVGRGQRVVQPRLWHRYQVDRHGLARSTHRLLGVGEDLTIELDTRGEPLQQILGAVYAVERFDLPTRHAVSDVLRKGMNWNGPVGPSLLAYLAGMSGARASSIAAMIDPIAWALDVLGFHGTIKPSKRGDGAVHTRLREVHPDHGGDRAALTARSATCRTRQRPESWARRARLLLTPGAGSDRNQSTLVAVDGRWRPFDRACDFPYHIAGRRRPIVSQSCSRSGPGGTLATHRWRRALLRRS
jgi:hypothetical protein